MRSRKVAGEISRSNSCRNALNSARSSEARTGRELVRPCTVAFDDDEPLPSGVRGPVEDWALARLVSCFEALPGEMSFHADLAIGFPARRLADGLGIQTVLGYVFCCSRTKLRS